MIRSRSCCKSFFLGNKKADNYEDLVAEMLFDLHDLECNRSIEIRF